MTAATREPLWRPYEDEPLFVPEITAGFNALDSGDAERLTRYLAALVTRRGVVQVATAFNAVYFGYDLTFGGYAGGPVDFNTFPQVRFGETTDALPVGAMVNIATGADPLYAEVVYKEGAHPTLGDDGDVPAWLSGAPTGARGRDEPQEPDAHTVLTERLVCDIDAFGTETVISAARLDRLRSRGRWLDTDGHLLVQARYASTVDAEVDDREFYVRYLLGPGRAQLLAGPLPLLLTDDAGEPQLAGALRAALGAVADALAATPSLRMWRDYAFPRAALAARLHDDGPLGREDLDWLAFSVGSPGRRRGAGPAVRYTAVGPLLRTLSGTAPQLVGLGYPAAVVHANTVIGDYARRDADDDGVLPTGAHLRLDDPWQGGGVWRASLPPGPYATVDPLLPYGLGWLEGLPATPESAATEVDEPTEETLDDTADLSVTDSHISWTVTLRLRHTLTGIAPLPSRAVEELDAAGMTGASLRLMLLHDGYQLDPAEATQEVRVVRVEGRTRVSGITWPLGFFPGIVLTFGWQRGANLVRARSTLLDTPVTIDGEDYEHRFDMTVITRDAAPGSVRRGQRRTGLLSLRERVLRAVRRLGLLDVDGVAILPVDRLPHAMYGVNAKSGAVDALNTIVAELAAAGELAIGSANHIDGRLCYPAVGGGERVQVLVWRPTAVAAPPRSHAPVGRQAAYAIDNARRADPMREDELTCYVLEYAVAPFLRRLPPGQQASDEARTEYQRLRSRHGLPGKLPPGYTLVRGHTRTRESEL